MSDQYDYPHIPLSELRNLYRRAQDYFLEGDFDERDLWHLFIRLEVDRKLAEHWYSEVCRLKKENEILKKKIGYGKYPGTEITTLSREEWDKAYLGEED